MRLKWVLIFIVSFLAAASPAAASPLGIAGDYNEFVFGSIDLQYTDSFGGVAAGGDATFKNVSVGSHNPTPLPAGDLVVGGNLDFDEGSVGYFAQNNSGDPAYQKGSIVVGGKAAFGLKDGSPNVGYGSLSENTQTIDFQAAWDHLTGVSSLWSGLSSNGTTDIFKNTAGDVYQVELHGSNETLNVFDLGALNQAGTVNLNDLGFYLDVPATSTILINVPGEKASFESFGYYFFDQATGEYIKGSEDKLGLFPDSRILYNFYEADALTMSLIEIHGSVLAPWADVVFYEGHIEGNLIAQSLQGRDGQYLDPRTNLLRPYYSGEAHDELFDGDLPVPEPSTCALIAVGLLALLLSRRRPAMKTA